MQNDKRDKKANLKKVLNELMSCMKLSANALAKTLNLPTPTIQRLLTGEVQDPRASTLTAIADYFGISIDQLLGREQVMSKVLDNYKNASIIHPPNSIPVFSLKQICNEEDVSKPTEWLRWQSQYKTEHETEFNRLFAISIKNNLYAPIFIAGTFIIINPKITLRSGDYVLVKFLNDSVAVIKKYIAEGGHKYLYSLKPDVKTISLAPKKCTIVGTIFESYVNFKSMED